MTCSAQSVDGNGLITVIPAPAGWYVLVACTDEEGRACEFQRNAIVAWRVDTWRSQYDHDLHDSASAITLEDVLAYEVTAIQSPDGRIVFIDDREFEPGQETAALAHAQERLQQSRERTELIAAARVAKP